MRRVRRVLGGVVFDDGVAVEFLMMTLHPHRRWAGSDCCYLGLSVRSRRGCRVGVQLPSR